MFGDMITENPKRRFRLPRLRWWVLLIILIVGVRWWTYERDSEQRSISWLNRHCLGNPVGFRYECRVKWMPAQIRNRLPRLIVYRRLSPSPESFQFTCTRLLSANVCRDRIVVSSISVLC